MAALSQSVHQKSSPLQNPSRILRNPVISPELLALPKATRRAEILSKHFAVDVSQLNVRMRSTLVANSPAAAFRDAGAFRCAAEKFFNDSPPRSTPEPGFNGQQVGEHRNTGGMLLEMLSAGIMVLSQAPAITAGQKLLCLQVELMDQPTGGMKIKQRIEGKSKAVHYTDTYQLEIKDAIAALYDHRGSWIHGCSILLDGPKDLHQKLHLFELEGKDKARATPRIARTKVILFAFVDENCQINYDIESGQDRLKRFLNQLGQKKLQAYLIC